jgi:receptor protein-tyrosine kinase
VPIVSAKWGVRKAPGPQHALDEQTSLFSEQLRAVWFRIKNSKAEARALLITSSVSGEGKTSIATSVARMQSLAGRRVAIIDGDLRNPNVHRVFGLRRSPGLTELIRRESQLEDVLQVDKKSGACVITAGAPVPSPADTLQSPLLARVIGALSENFDLVIMDSPPVLAVHDAAILARTADCTVMVVRWGSTKVATFLSALQHLSDFGVQVDGVVLSMVDSKKYIHYSDSELNSRGFRRYYVKS